MYSGVNLSQLAKSVRNLYFYKIRANSRYFCGLILLQVITALMLMLGSATMGVSSGNLNIMLRIYSAQIVMLFSVIWSLIISMLIASRTNKDAAITVSSHRLSDCLADLSFILTGCLFGGVTTVLLAIAMRVQVYFAFMGSVIAQGFYPAFGDLCIIAVATMLYMLLLSSGGYFIGVLMRLNKAFIILLGALIGSIFISRSAPRVLTLLPSFIGLIANEKSLAFFALLVAVTSVILFLAAIVISNRMEVRK